VTLPYTDDYAGYPTTPPSQHVPDGITHPSIDELLEKAGSKYQLVLYASKRARQINAYYSQLGEGLLEYVGPLVETHVQEKPLSVAMREINADLLSYTHGVDDSEPSTGRPSLDAAAAADAFSDVFAATTAPDTFDPAAFGTDLETEVSDEVPAGAEPVDESEEGDDPADVADVVTAESDTAEALGLDTEPADTLPDDRI
jgi:DNA-directed RNA polymerase subunit omega